MKTNKEKLPKSLSSKKYLFFFSVGLLTAILVMRSWHSSATEVPQELQGLWVTSDPAYQDRSLEISQVTITFGTGNATESTGFIQKCEVSTEGPETAYTILYSGDDGEAKLSLSYNPVTKELRLKNQRSIAWHKST